MKFTCPRKEFHEAVSATANAASTRSSQAVLQSIKIEATDGVIRLSGCDSEMWVERQVACLIEETGAICVPAKLLADIVASLPEGDVEFSTDISTALLKQGASEYRVNTLDAADFPTVPAFGGENSLTLTLGEFREAVSSVIFAVSTDQHRALLTGALLRYDGENLTLVATDTHRLAVRKLHKPGGTGALDAVVPEKALRAIQSLPFSDEFELTLQFGGGRVGVESDGVKVVTQLLSGQYPNWERVVPAASTRAWKVEADQLEQDVKRVLIYARDSAFRVRFKGSDSNLVISARSEEKGDGKEELTMISENGDVEIAFNGKYVLNALEPIKGPGVKIEMTEATRPAIFRPAEDESDYFCVIMPMSLS